MIRYDSRTSYVYTFDSRVIMGHYSKFRIENPGFQICSLYISEGPSVRCVASLLKKLD